MTLPPQLLVNTKFPDDGALLKNTWPLIEYVLVAGLHALGVAVTSVILHKIAQFVVAALPAVLVKVMLPGRFE